jgi:hypothetical protein
VKKYQDREPSELKELDNLIKIVGSPEWFSALKVIGQHKQYLQEEVNNFVEKQDLINAYGALQRLKDADKIFRLIKARLEQLKKGAING